MLIKGLFWGSLGAILWTHAGYPVAAAALARLRPRPVRKDDIEPEVTVIVPAHNEEDVIERRLEDLLALDYPADSCPSSSLRTPPATAPTSSSRPPPLTTPASACSAASAAASSLR